MSNTAAFKNFLSPQFSVFSLFFFLFLVWRCEILQCMGFGLGRLAFSFSFHQDRVPFVQHLHRTTSGASGNSAALCMTLKWNYFFMHFRRVSRASLSDQREPFVLLQQVFLIKNVISLTNCFIAFAAGVIVFMVLYLCDSLREQKTGRTGASFLLCLPCACCCSISHL